MKIGIITPRYPPNVRGGGEISVQLLANQLSSRVDSVEVFSFDGNGKSSVNGITVHRLCRLPHDLMEISNPYALYALYKKRDYLASFDILHAYNIALNPAVGNIASKFNIASVATLNSYDLLSKFTFGVTPDYPRRLYELLAMPTTGRILRHEVKKIDQFIALSEASRSVYQENGFDDVPIDVVPNMLDPSFGVSTAESKSDYHELLYVGSLIEEKGVSYLVQAMDELPDSVRLRIVGSGTQSTKLQALADDLGVSSRIEFSGHVSYKKLCQYYEVADLFVHPGVWPEPFGRTILEAMQAGLPVVVTDVGGPTEIVPHEDLRCEPRNPTALAKSILSARNRANVGEQNREHVHKRYAPNVVVKEILDVYENVIEGT